MEGVVVVSDGYEYGRWLLGASFPHSWSLCEYNSLTVVTTRSQPMSQQMNAAVSVVLTRSADGRDDRESFVAKRIRSVRNAWRSLRTSAPAACGLSLHLVRLWIHPFSNLQEKLLTHCHQSHVHIAISLLILFGVNLQCPSHLTRPSILCC
jgi:hypothetical protein